MDLQPTQFTLGVLNEYRQWWNNPNNVFKGQTATLSQREYALNSSKRINYQCPQASIPYIEISPLYRIAEGGILFVNCNPSGTDYEYYRDYNKNNEDCFCYGIYKPDNSYFNADEEFVKNGIGASVEYAMIDVFPLVIQNQDVLKKAFYNAYKKNPLNLRDAFDELLVAFLDHITTIKPRVIIATNAFVKDIFTQIDSPLLNLQNKKYSIREDSNRVCYYICIDGFETTLFCGGMIAGGHQMDTESKKRLIRDVRHYYSEQRGFPR